MQLFFRSKIVEISRGEFACPKCRSPVPYRRKERVERSFFHLVPILGDTLEEYIECQTCRQRFPLSVLRVKLPESTEKLIEGLKEKLSAGLSIEEAESSLGEAGMKIGDVKQYISVAAGIGRKRCPECNLTYRKNVLNCRKCSHGLPPAPILGGS